MAIKKTHIKVNLSKNSIIFAPINYSTDKGYKNCLHIKVNDKVSQLEFKFHGFFVLFHCIRENHH